MQTLDPNPQAPSPFLLLPLELRDLIYAYALPPTLSFWLTNRHTGIKPHLTLFAEHKSCLTPRIFYLHDSPLIPTLQPPSKHKQKGLPSWLLTSKAILHEATKVIRREYVWMVGERFRWDGGKRSDILNWRFGDMVGTLVLGNLWPGWIGPVLRLGKKQSMHRLVEEVEQEKREKREMEIRYPKRISLDLGFLEELIMSSLRGTGARLTELSMYWSFCSTCPEPVVGAYIWSDVMEMWAGRVDKVRIRFGSHDASIDAGSGKVRELVERAARRLVCSSEEDEDEMRDAVRVRWEEEPNFYLRDAGATCEKFKFYVIVERRKISG